MAKLTLQIPLHLGLWTRRNAQGIPPGALRYARNTILSRSGGVSRRAGSADLDSTALSVTGHGITQFETVDGSVSNFVVHAGANIYTGATGKTTTLSSDDTNMSDAGPTTFAFYNDRLLVSDGSSVTRVMDTDGSVDRRAGVPNDRASTITAGSSGTTNFVINNGVHLTYRYWDSVNNVYSDPPTDGAGNIIYSTLAAGTYDAITIDGLPAKPPPDTEVDTLVILSTVDETNPTTFYPIRLLPFGASFATTDRTYISPSAAAKTSGYTRGFSNASNAYDASFTSSSSAQDNAIESSSGKVAGTNWSGFETQGGTSTGWRVHVKWSISDTELTAAEAADYSPDATYVFTVKYSTDSGSTFPNTLFTQTGLQKTTTDNDVAVTETSEEISGSVNPSTVVVQALYDLEAGTFTKPGSPTVNIHDIRVIKFDTTTHQAILRGVSTADSPLPSGAETPFVNAANVGQFQPPPNRIFPTVYEGHMLGRSNTNGLFLAYSVTDAPEAWSTDPSISAFPYLIPFKEKEADELVGAEKVAKQLIVMATDSIWRINHLPVLSDPSGQTADLFAEARSTSKVRVTDVVGCVGVRAYARLQLSSDEDYLFFWSRLGPMLTDGYRVWRVADHVDWSFLNANLTATVVTNETARQIVWVDLRSAEGSANDLSYAFHYDEDHMIGEGQVRLAVSGPHDEAFADRAEVKLTDGTKMMVAVAGTSSGAERGQTYRLNYGTTDADTGSVPTFQFNLGRIGTPGMENHFDHLTFNVQETGSRTFAMGGTSVTPDVPVDKDPLNIDEAGRGLEIQWADDTVTMWVTQEDGADTIANQAPETVTFTTSSRDINSATLWYDDGAEVKD